MKTLIEMWKFQIKTGGCQVFIYESNSRLNETKKHVPTIIVEDTDKLIVEANYLDDVRTPAVSLRRQSKFMKGAERPKLFSPKNLPAKRNVQPSVSCQNLSTASYKNLSNSSCENLGKPPVPSRQSVNQKLYSDNNSDQDSGFWSFRSGKYEKDDVKNESCSRNGNFKRRESYQRAINIESPGYRSSFLKSRHETPRTIKEENTIYFKSQLTRFSSHSHLPNVC